jgi:hypothetical protein
LINNNPIVRLMAIVAKDIIIHFEKS